MTIRELRRTRKLSQKDLAEQLGITHSAVSQMESGRLKVSDRVADRIWELYGVEVGEMGIGKPVKKAKPRKLEIYIQSPMGGNITPEEVAAKMPKGAERAYVRVDQNLIWWVRGDETGSVEIWE